MNSQSLKNNVWNDEDVNTLIKLYPDTTNLEICNLLNKTYGEIAYKALKLNLKKSKKHKSKMISKRNKMVSRDLTYDFLKEIAKKYKSISEFTYYDKSAVSAARKKGIFKEITKHMIKENFSIPQLITLEICKKIFKNVNILYDYKEIIKPYELDIFIDDYKLAFEYNGKRWHQFDTINKEKLCLDQNILLITIIENNRKYELDIKEQIISKLEIINSWCNLQLTKENIENIIIDYKFIFNSFSNLNDIKCIIDKYNNLKDFVSENKKIVNRLKRLNLYDEYTKNLYKLKKWTIENVISEVAKYNNLKDFIENSYGCYLHTKKNNLEYLTSHLKRKKRLLNLEYCIKIINDNKIKTKYSLKKIDSSIFIFLKKKIGISNINDILYQDK